AARAHVILSQDEQPTKWCSFSTDGKSGLSNRGCVGYVGRMADHSHSHADVHSHRHADMHAHGHSHPPRDFGRAFAIGIGLNLAFLVIETIYGFLANSMALLADAGHNLSDVLGLVVAWAAAVMA